MSKSRHLVDAQIRPMLDVLPTIELTEELLPVARSAPPRLQLDPADLERSEMVFRIIPGPRGAPDVGLRIYRPKGATGSLPCIFHIHGGGYVLGDTAMMEPIHRPFSAELKCCIVSVEYRLAPETRFPGAIEDCYAALDWVFANAREIGVDTTRIGVMGESAGGGYAASLALMVRDRGEYKFTFQHLIYPMLDDRTCVALNPNPFVGEFIWNAHSNRFGWSALLGVEPGSPGVSAYAAAARAEDLSGLPPTFMLTGALDLFLEEDIEYARRLMRSGVPVELHVYPGAIHGFNVVPGVEIAANARRESLSALARALT